MRHGGSRGRGVALGMLGAAALLLAGYLATGPRMDGGLHAGADEPPLPRRILLEKDEAWSRQARGLEREGLRVVADYGRLVLAEMTAPRGRALLGRAGIRIRRELADGVRLRRRTIGAADNLGPLTGRGLHVVKFDGPPRPGWVASLRSLPGVEVLSALPEGAYIVWLGRDGAESLSHLPVPPEITARMDRTDRLSPDLDAPGEPVEVAAWFIATPAGEAAAAAALDRSGSVTGVAPRLKGLEGVLLSLSRNDLEEISGWEELVWAEPWRRFELHDEISSLLTAGRIANGLPPGPQYREWLSSHGLGDLSEWTVHVMDSGIDSGLAGASHPALAGRVLSMTNETTESSGDDCVGHGTHIAGIVAGNPGPGSALVDSGGFELGLGIAPTARLVGSRIFTCSGNLEVRRSFTEIFTDAWSRGARISNNSWGMIGAAYNALASEFDAIVRDVDGDALNGEQPMVVVASTGNLGPQAFTLGTPALSKNVLAVGATESVRPEGTDGCGLGPQQADDPDDIRSSSSRGPTSDGRLKPEIVAPGSHILSTASQGRDYTGLGLCNTYYPPGQRLYTWTSGTSQAAAHVSGAAVLVMESYRREHGAAPSPAMVKAAFAATAHDVGDPNAVFSGTVLPRPTNAQGWGRIDLTGLTGDRPRIVEDQSHVFAASGEEVIRGPFFAADPTRPVGVVLAWTDPPGTPAGSAWVNDLDLEVVARGATYLGNVLQDGFSVTGGTHDARNNLEAVFFAPGTVAAFSVRVTAVSLPGDGVPGAPGATDQDFALYVDNALAPAPGGSLAFAGSEASCGGEAAVILTGRSLAGLDRISIQAGSATEPGGESFEVWETPPGSGIFRGTVPLAAGAPAPDGLLQAADGDNLLASYLHTDGATGATSLLTASATARCSALSISQVTIEAQGPTRAAISWKTSRPADSTVTGDPAIDVSDPTRVTDHHVVLEGLSPCSAYDVTISSTDGSGTSAVAPATGAFLLTTGSALRMPLFRDDLEKGRAGWAHGGVADEWELGAPQTGPPTAASGVRVWGTDLDGTYDAGSDSHLTLPPVNLRGLAGAALKFRHYLDIPLAVAPGDPQDGGWVEASIDGGMTWVVLGPDTGYPVNAGPNNPYLPRGSGVFAGKSLVWSNVRIDLASLGRGEVLLRFRMWRDPTGTAPAGAGWYIDDVEVETGFPCGIGTLSLDQREYGCDSTVGITLADEDIDRDPTQTGFASVLAEINSGPVAIQLRETTPSSRVYTGSIQLSSSGAPGTMAIQEGGTLQLRYEDKEDGAGSPAELQAVVTVPDCTPPSPPQIPTLEQGDSGQLQLHWTDPPDPDLSEVRVHYDSDSPGPIYSGHGAAEGSSPLRAEKGRRSLLLTGLPACVPHFISLTAVDNRGNQSAFSTELIGIPFTGAPCARATVLLGTEAGAGCSQLVPVRVDDANADPDPATAGSIAVLATSDSSPVPLPLQLVESGPATGTFLGLLPLSPTPEAGLLHVGEGDTIVVTYDDLNTGAGAGAPISARLPLDDCRAPLFTSLAPPRLFFSEVELAFSTDEPTSSVVEYGLDPGLEATLQSSALRTEHSITIPSFAGCSTLYYRITAKDHRDNVAIADDGGLPFHLGTPRVLLSFQDDFESGGRPGWSSGGSHDEWELGAPGFLVPIDPNYSPGLVWGTDLNGTYDAGADMMLTAPPFDLTGLDSAYLSFHHWYDIHSDSPVPGAGFDDGAWLEVSADGGMTWKYISPVGGYPDVIATNPYIERGTPVYAGKTDAWEEAIFPLDDFVGGPILVRFHLYQDQFDPPLPGLGWYIDDVKLHTAVPCRQGRIHMDVGSGNCGASPLTIRLWDLDLDVDPAAPDTATIDVESSSGSAPLPLTLQETGDATGEFRGILPFDRMGGPGVLRVEDGDTVTATYSDDDDGTGQALVAVSSATIRDCTMPVITNPAARAVGEAHLEITWETDEPATSEVEMPPGNLVASSVALDTAHRLLVASPPSCTEASFAVASTDAGGNRSVASQAGAGYPVEPIRKITVFAEGFESGAPGWEVGGDPGEWEVGAPVIGPPGAFAGASVAGTDLDGTYDKDTHRQGHESWLLSPPISLQGLETAALTMAHFHRFAPPEGGDGGIVEVLDRDVWVPVVPMTGYTGSLRTDRGGGSVPAFVGSASGWSEARFDLSAFLGRSIRIRLRMVIDHGTPSTAEGWYVDAFRVEGSAPCHRGTIQLDREEYGCDATRAALLLSDADLDLDAGTAEMASVAVSDGTTSIDVALVETGPATGVFAGEVPLSTSGGVGTLRLDQGTTITASYDDLDAGSGAPGAAVATASVGDCSPPTLGWVRAEPRWSGAVLEVRWETDEPATTDATLTMSGQPPRRVTTLDMVTDHVARFHDVPDCSAYSVIISSRDAAGNTSTASGPAQPYTGETRSETRLLADNMEAPAQGWSSFGTENEWARGVPEAGPPGALSGTRVSGTDLQGRYEAGANEVLRSPPIDLRSVPSARLSFWHFYDVFANGTPNADDDGAWVEIQQVGAPSPTHVLPLDGYNNTIDRDGAPPIQGGSGAFAGNSVAWQRSVVDLTPFLGQLVQIQFHLWNDAVEGPINRQTGFGWYIDDVLAISPGTCFPAPAVTSASTGLLKQGSAGIPLSFTGTGIREPFSLSAGPGITIRALTPGAPGSWTALLDVEDAAAVGPRALVVRNPDGQEGTLTAAFDVAAEPRRADIDGSGVVDAADLAILAAAFGSFAGEPAYRIAADISGDGIVDGADLAILAPQLPVPLSP